MVDESNIGIDDDISYVFYIVLLARNPTMWKSIELNKWFESYDGLKSEEMIEYREE